MIRQRHRDADVRFEAVDLARLESVADFANRLGALVASRPGGTPEWSLAELEGLRL